MKQIQKSHATLESSANIVDFTQRWDRVLNALNTRRRGNLAQECNESQRVVEAVAMGV